MRLIPGLLLLWFLPCSANINVVTSIEPLYQITKSIMQGVGEPGILITNRASTHHFAFKPSHLKALKKADLVIWVDRYFENGFQNLDKILRPDTERLELLRELKLNTEDGHFWYSPVILLKGIQHIQSTLGRIDAQHASEYSRNADRLSLLIGQWEDNTRSQIKNNRPIYLLDHSFLGQFELDMGIEAVARLHDAHDQPGSVKDLRDIENKLQQTPAKCILTNRQPASQLARNLAKKFDLPIYDITLTSVSTDKLSELMPGLHQLSATLLKCH
jgi:zinc transport system substrate-binding protein